MRVPLKHAICMSNIHSTMNSTNTYALFLQGETLFRTVIEVTGGGGAAGASGGSSEAAVRTALEDYMAHLPEPLNMVEVMPLPGPSITRVYSANKCCVPSRQQHLTFHEQPKPC